ncbi:MAG: hypothetical protein AAGA48_12460 [Myxococcota bacterium]
MVRSFGVAAFGLLITGGLMTACAPRPGAPATPDPGTPTATGPTAPTPAPQGPAEASVTEVAVTGEAGAYTFAVTIASDETGCEQYADWWEVVTAEDEGLVYRRILTHSHPNEQPFTRSGGPVDVAADTELLVRAHLNPSGYQGSALRGTVADGFATEVAADALGTSLETSPPQPDGCLF